MGVEGGALGRAGLPLEGMPVSCVEGMPSWVGGTGATGGVAVGNTAANEVWLLFIVEETDCNCCWDGMVC